MQIKNVIFAIKLKKANKNTYICICNYYCKMKVSAFKSGKWVNQYQYKSFLPETINHAWTIDDDRMNLLLSQAAMHLGELNAFSSLIPDVDIFIKMHVQKEAMNSSRIEGTRTSIEESLNKEENIDPDKRNDWLEVRNYVSAMNASVMSLNKLPLSGRLMKQTHKILMIGVCGEAKNPGEFRSSQNWIGGRSIKDAVFIPPHPHDLPDLISDLETFMNNNRLSVPELVKAGIAHYQFETIHPFLDGNGRVGRLLITLQLVSQGLLQKPTLYLSDYFEKNRSEYYSRLSKVRTDNDLNGWLMFFLEGVRQTSADSALTFRKIIELRKKTEKKLMKPKKASKSAFALHDFMYRMPVFEAQDVADELGVNISTAYRMTEQFMKSGILEESTGFKRNRVFVFRSYIDLFR